MSEGEVLPGETIAAIATPSGKGAIAVIKISGKTALKVAAGCLSPRGARKLAASRARSAFVDRVISPLTGEPVDEVVVLVMKGPRSYTGEDVVEFQCHGGELVAEKVLESVLLCGARAAEPGEFTRRAFLNGKMSLDEAEAVVDVVGAKTERALRQAFLRLEGNLGRSVLRWRQRLGEVLATIQGALDFPDDVWLLEQEARCALQDVGERISEMVQGGVLGLALASGVQVALTGRPNAGKSSLFNALIGEDRAIVTDVPGTTRDVLRERVEWGGIPVVLVDTAGLRQTQEVVEAIGVERARLAAEESWAIIYVVDGTAGLGEDDWFWLRKWQDRRLVVVASKSDIVPGEKTRDIVSTIREGTGFPVISVSSTEGSGVGEVKETVIRMFGGAERDSVVPGSARQMACLRRARDALDSALEAWGEGWTLDVVACGVEEACRALDELTGSRVTEDVLDEIFSRFCVGK